MGVSSLLSDLITNDLRTAIAVVVLTTSLLLNLAKNNATSTSDNNNNNDDGDCCIAKVSGIYIHPVKSMRSISLLESTINLEKRCLTDDRRFMVVYELPLPVYKKKWELNDTTHRFLTQRQCPSLATISATIDVDDFLILEKQSFPHEQTYLAGLWDNVVVVEDLGDDAASFIQRIVDDDDEFSSTNRKIVVRLVSQPRRDNRNYIPDYAKTWNGSKLGLTSLTDGFPILIASESSLDELNKRLIASGKDSIPMSRFRPNIVIQGGNLLQPFEEDKWKIILIGDIVFAIVKACPRCKQSCTDQITGKVSPEPVEIMKSFRQCTSSSDDDGGAVFFAQNAIPIGRIEGRSIKVGDTVKVLERGDPVYID
ncbi:MOSC-domain-containing protein [Fragilariopsis cylindrus CCMP1102]|uniref:MOSC-domain-containing protein n=1 Tax=Fragilariopsis cylindrus CCMP1102 TaxID=635003 RepID=A0A1E7FVJ1_9STRA|nr:MOSC-domain-containing protein [Fragilariopsis cylindrus CCMP1102]|eukprot:OEU22144.1 MOSC-domain-containing protein [Fragilariopsis cylindrus CCMP1102]